MFGFPRRRFLQWGAGLFLAPPALSSLQSSLLANPVPDTSTLIDGPPPPVSPGSFTIAVLPDTQGYTLYSPELFVEQTAWLAAQQKSRNIVAALHLGDITDKNTPAEWENAVRALKNLDDVIPYFLVPGNHDYSEGGRCVDRTTLMNDYFPVSKFKTRPTFGGVYDKEPDRIENSFHRFVANDHKFLVLALEFGPRKDVLRWANEVVSKHADHQVILTTHAYMYFDDTRYDWKKYGTKQKWNPHSYGVAQATGDDVNDAEEIWKNLISKHENFFMTLNGHVLGDGLGQLTSKTPQGGEVHQLLVNFQMLPRRGDGWLRLMEFQADGKTIQIRDYSPSLNKLNIAPSNQFTLNWKSSN